MFGKVNNWPMGAALSVGMMLTVAMIALTLVGLRVFVALMYGLATAAIVHD